MLYFENDYCEGAHPAILQKLTETNFEKVSGYGTDPYCASAKEKIRAACACPEADVFFISGGTHHYQYTKDFYSSYLGLFPRRSCEMVFAMFCLNVWADNTKGFRKDMSWSV